MFFREIWHLCVFWYVIFIVSSTVWTWCWCDNHLMIWILVKQLYVKALIIFTLMQRDCWKAPSSLILCYSKARPLGGSVHRTSGHFLGLWPASLHSLTTCDGKQEISNIYQPDFHWKTAISITFKKARMEEFSGEEVLNMLPTISLLYSWVWNLKCR